MKEIPLTQGQFALVDDDDYDYLMQWKWQAQKNKGTYYATRHPMVGVQIQGLICMHRLIMKTTDGLEVDHVDHNGLNNQKENLRNCTRSQNHMNKKVRGISIYHGVSIRRNGDITAQIKINGKRKHIGYFKTEIDAAVAYDAMASKYFGEFANLNFK